MERESTSQLSDNLRICELKKDAVKLSLSILDTWKEKESEQ